MAKTNKQDLLSDRIEKVLHEQEKTLVDLTLGVRVPITEKEEELAQEVEAINEKGRIV